MVYTNQYRKMIYQEIKKDKTDFPVMNKFMNHGVVRADPNAEDNPLFQAKKKFKRMTAPTSVELRGAGPKFDYEKVKRLYNASLLDTELHDPLKFMLKKKQDAKTCIMHVFKRKYEEKAIH